MSYGQNSFYVSAVHTGWVALNGGHCNFGTLRLPVLSCIYDIHMHIDAKNDHTNEYKETREYAYAYSYQHDCKYQCQCQYKQTYLYRYE